MLRARLQAGFCAAHFTRFNSWAKVFFLGVWLMIQILFLVGPEGAVQQQRTGAAAAARGGNRARLRDQDEATAPDVPTKLVRR